MPKKLVLPTETPSSQYTAVEEARSQPQSAAESLAEMLSLGQILATLMSERNLNRNETARLFNIQPQTIKNALDGKSVNGRFVLRTIDVFELRHRPNALRYLLISHLSLQLGDNWLDIFQRARLVGMPAKQHFPPPPLAPCDVRLTNTLSAVLETLHMEPSKLAIQCNVSPRVVRECLRGKNISAQLVRRVSALLRKDDTLLRRVLLSYMAQQYGTDSIALMIIAQLVREDSCA